MTNYSQDLFLLNRPKYDALVAEAKKARAAARRAEAKGDYEKASSLRDKVDGINSELAQMRG